MKDVVYGAGVAKGSDSEWDYLWNIYNTTTDPQEQSIILRALAQSKHLWILNRSVHCVCKIGSHFSCCSETEGELHMNDMLV